MNSKKNRTLVSTICGFLIALVGAFMILFGDKNVVLSSTTLFGSIVACFGLLYVTVHWYMVLLYRLDELEDIVEKLGGNQDERTEDP